MSTVYKIHPAIGIGRVGNSPDYYLSPAAAGALPTEYSTPPAPGASLFRDAQSNLLRQGVRFQVYAYDDTNPNDPGTPVVVGQNNVVGIKWTAWIASKKSSWFQFAQHTGSGMGPYESTAPTTPPTGSDAVTIAYAFNNDLGYAGNNQLNPWVTSGNPTPAQSANPPTNPDLPSNPLRYNNALKLSANPATIAQSARQQLILDPGPQTLTGPNQQAPFNLAAEAYPFLITLQPFQISTLGEMQTDANSNLIMLPGFGNSGSTDTPTEITYYGSNHGWFDDIADGPVNAEVVLGASTTAPVVGGWFTVAPPKYAPEAVNMITMYDNIYDVLVRESGYNPSLYSGGLFNSLYQPSFADEVLPILQRPAVYQWFTDMPTNGKNAHANLLPTGSPSDPNYVAEVASFATSFAGTGANYLRGRGLQVPKGKPAPAENIAGLMPRLAGDNPISNFTISKYLGLTQTQYFILTQFAKKLYTLNPQAGLPPGASGPGPQLDRAQLENCVGGPFSPGIEITWITRNPAIYAPRPSQNVAASDWFRINATPLSTLNSGQLSLTNGSDNLYAAGLEPGDLSKYMAQPWQADFNECTNQNINIPMSAAPLSAAPNLNTPAVTGDQAILWWWPVQRPWYVYPQTDTLTRVPWDRGFLVNSGTAPMAPEPADLQMVTCWKYMGFVKKVPVAPPSSEPPFQEVDRLTAQINDYTNANPTG